MDNILSKVLLDEAKKKWHDLTQEATDPAKIVALSLCFEDALKLVKHIAEFAEKTIDEADKTRKEIPTIQPSKAATPVVTQVQTPMMSSFPAFECISAPKGRHYGQYYAVARGRKIGVFNTWPECQASTNGFSDSKFKRFDTHEEAMKFVEENRFHSSSNPSSNKRRSLPMEEISPKRPAVVDDEVPVVYIHGSFYPGGKSKAKAGFGVYWGDDDPNNLSLPATGAPTNNRAEYEAILSAMKQALDKDYDRILIRSNSKIHVLTFNNLVEKWKKNGWRTNTGKDVPNGDLIQAIDEMRAVINVKFEYDNSPDGTHGNENARELAKLGAQKFRPQHRFFDS